MVMGRWVEDGKKKAIGKNAGKGGGGGAGGGGVRGGGGGGGDQSRIQKVMWGRAIKHLK